MRGRTRTWLRAVAAGAACLAWSGAALADASTLWHLVHDRCVPSAEHGEPPKPCLRVDRARGTALLKDRNGATQYLLLATERRSGIEDPRVLRRSAPNYFAEAWRDRDAVEALAGPKLTREELSLAINSPQGRTQDQLHIHIDCIRPDVRAILETERSHIGLRWKPLGALLDGHRYQAARLYGEELHQNPFKLLAFGQPGARHRMARHSLAIVGTRFSGRPGFILLNGEVDPKTGDRASAEELQDHSCAILRP